MAKGTKGNVAFNINETARQDALDILAGKASGSVNSTMAKQLVTRNPEDSFETLEDLILACEHSRNISRQAQVNLAELSVIPENGLSLMLPNGSQANLTHYSLGQLLRKIGFNSMELINRLPAQLASEVMNHGLKNLAYGSVDKELQPWETDSLVGGKIANSNAKLLWRENNVITLDSVTSANYGRFFDYELGQFALKVQQQNKLSGLPLEGLIRSGLKGSFFHTDRDCFIALRDNDRRIFERDPNGGLSRMLLLSNSEVDGRPLKIEGLYYSYVCANWNIWDSTQAFTVSMRHSKNLLNNFKPDDMLGAINAFFERSPEVEETFIEKCRKFELADNADKCIEEMLRVASPVIGKKFAKQIMEDAVLLEDKYNASPRSAWTLGNAITERAQECKYTADRVTLTGAASLVFDMAA